MSSIRFIVATSIAVAACGGRPVAVSSPSALPPVRDIGQSVAQLGLGTNRPVEVRPLSDGRVIVLQPLGRRLDLVDRDLRSTTPILDATNPQPVAFPSGVGHLIAAPGDTTWVLDIAAQAYRVISPTGKVVRRVPADPRYLRPFGSTTTTAAFDARGRIVYLDQLPHGPPVRGLQPRPDSFTVARIDPAGTGRDSLAALKANGSSPREVVRDGKTVVILPIPLVDFGDAWAVTSDGAVAMIRASDFHVDWILPDGRRTSTPPVPWPWHRFTSAEKDSLRAVARTIPIQVGSRSTGGAPDPVPPFAVEAEVQSDPPAVAPAFAPLSAMGDLEGRVWVRLGARGPGAPRPTVYGIIDRSGAMVDRVQFPPLRTLAGFAPDGFVYVIATSPQGASLERYRYSKP